MKLYLTRHGQTDWNQRRIIQGKTDIALNDIGREQARITRDALADVTFSCIYTSPLLRAVETAEIINEYHQVPIYKDDRIAERGFGKMEGASIEQVDFTRFWCVEDESLFPDCESTSGFYHRVHAFIDEKKEDGDATILVVAHGGVSLPFYTYFHGFPDDHDMRKYMLNNCEFTYYNI